MTSRDRQPFQFTRRTMTSEELKKRTKAFAIAIILLDSELPKKRAADIIYGQLLRASSSVGANYRSACRARSRAEFISKITIVEEEADESVYWLELFVESGLMKLERLAPLIKEARELTAIFTSSGKTAKSNRK
jgi:four helix bundle protein